MIPPTDSLSEPSSAEEARCRGLPIAADWKAAFKLHFQSTGGIQRWLIPIVGIAYALFVFWMIGPRPLAFGLAMAVPLLLVGIRWARITSVIRQTQAKAKKMDGYHQWIFGPRRVSFEWGSSHASFEWSALDRLVITDGMILLYPNPRLFNCIPIRFFSNPDDAEKVVGFAAAAHVPIRDFRKGIQ